MSPSTTTTSNDAGDTAAAAAALEDGKSHKMTTRKATTGQRVVAATQDVTRRMICGGVAGMIAKTVTNPLDRIRMLAQTGEHGVKATTTAKGAATASSAPVSVYTLYRNILKQEGWMGLWAGNGANLLRVFPAKAVVFSSQDFYSQGIRHLHSLSQKSRRPAEGGIPATAASGGMVGFWAGGLAGMTATACTYPLDFARGRIAGKLAAEGQTKAYAGIWQTMMLTVREEGVLALYRGATPTLLGAMPYEGIKFGTVGILEKAFPKQQDGGGNRRKTSSPWRKMLFGGIGGIMAALITYPNDTVRRLLQLQGSRGTDAQYHGYWDCVRQTYAAGGMGRFYRGFTLNVIRMAPNTAVQFGSYELLKQWTANW